MLEGSGVAVEVSVGVAAGAVTVGEVVAAGVESGVPVGVASWAVASAPRVAA